MAASEPSWRRLVGEPAHPGVIADELEQPMEGLVRRLERAERGQLSALGWSRLIRCRERFDHGESVRVGVGEPIERADTHGPAGCQL